ncbi:MAG TPA: transglutaminase family protein [Acidimicrobiales bacterium]|nr:transglutaminase family protein [Acidimicrobiales bacterium]
MLAEADQDERYLLEQQFRYTYASPVRSLRHRLVVVPRAVHGTQQRFDHGLSVTGGAARAKPTSDAFANHVVEIRATGVEEWIQFDTWALVGVQDGRGVSELPPNWAGRGDLLAPTPLTHPDAGLAEAAAHLSAISSGPMDLAERACSWTYQAMSYEYGITDVHTDAVTALTEGRGVCQDYAHVMLALCHAARLPARYVSGHLVGEGGSHAWVEVIVQDQSPGYETRWVAVAFDPTHNRRAGRGYVTVAVGRDYSDVAPTSGTFEGTGPGVLSVRKRLSPTEAPHPGT